MPVAALVEDKILCMHGGLSTSLTSWESIRKLKRGTDVPETGLMCDLLWADPDPDISGVEDNERGVSIIFGKEFLNKFLKDHNLDLICRAH